MGNMVGQENPPRVTSSSPSLRRPHVTPDSLDGRTDSNITMGLMEDQTWNGFSCKENASVDIKMNARHQDEWIVSPGMCTNGLLRWLALTVGSALT